MTIDEVIASLRPATAMTWWATLARQLAQAREHYEQSFHTLADKATREIDTRLFTNLNNSVQRMSLVVGEAFVWLYNNHPELLPLLPRLDGRPIDPQAAADAVLEVVAALLAKRKEPVIEEALRGLPKDLKPNELDVMRLLYRKALTGPELLRALGRSSLSQLSKNTLKPLKENGLISNQPRRGYYRPDAPPPME